VTQWLRKLSVKKLRTGLSWADWHRPNALKWLDYQIQALAEFDITLMKKRLTQPVSRLGELSSLLPLKSVCMFNDLFQRDEATIARGKDGVRRGGAFGGGNGLHGAFDREVQSGLLLYCSTDKL
jgi:hypothetical protein